MGATQLRHAGFLASKVKQRKSLCLLDGFLMLVMPLLSKVRRSRWLISAVALVVLAFIPEIVLALDSRVAPLRGEVQDASGARVAGAQVVVLSIGSAASREATANDRGEFRRRTAARSVSSDGDSRRFCPGLLPDHVALLSAWCAADCRICAHATKRARDGQCEGNCLVDCGRNN